METKKPTFLSTAPQMQVIVDPVSWSEIMYMTRAVDTEISFMLNVYLRDDIIYVKDVYLPKQENTGASTDMDAGSIGEIPLAKDGYTNCWVHSHVNMSAFWSGTDYQTIRQLGRHGYVLAIVVNKKGEYKCAYYQKGDKFFPPIFIDDITIKVEHILDASHISKMDEAIKTQCTERKAVFAKDTLGNIGKSKWFDTRFTNTVDWDKDLNKLVDKADEWDFKPIPKKLKKKLLQATGLDADELEDYWEDYQYMHHDTPTQHQFLEYLYGFTGEVTPVDKEKKDVQ